MPKSQIIFEKMSLDALPDVHLCRKVDASGERWSIDELDQLLHQDFDIKESLSKEESFKTRIFTLQLKDKKKPKQLLAFAVCHISDDHVGVNYIGLKDEPHIDGKTLKLLIEQIAHKYPDKKLWFEVNEHESVLNDLKDMRYKTDLQTDQQIIHFSKVPLQTSILTEEYISNTEQASLIQLATKKLSEVTGIEWGVYIKSEVKNRIVLLDTALNTALLNEIDKPKKSMVMAPCSAIESAQKKALPALTKLFDFKKHFKPIGVENNTANTRLMIPLTKDYINAILTTPATAGCLEDVFISVDAPQSNLSIWSEKVLDSYKKSSSINENTRS